MVSGEEQNGEFVTYLTFKKKASESSVGFFFEKSLINLIKEETDGIYILQGNTSWRKKTKSAEEVEEQIM